VTFVQSKAFGKASCWHRNAMSRIDKSSTRTDKMIKQSHYLNSVQMRNARQAFPCETLYLHEPWSKTLIASRETRFMHVLTVFSAVLPSLLFFRNRRSERWHS
jgi:hypothetical protein